MGRLMDQSEGEGARQESSPTFCKLISQGRDSFLLGVSERGKEHKEPECKGNSFTWKQEWRVNITLNDIQTLHVHIK